MQVTFDSNVWEHVVCPETFPKDPHNAELVTLKAAIQDRKIQARVVETVVSLEAIKRADRAAYLAGRTPAMSVKESADGARLRVEVTIGADHSGHPGLKPVLEDRIRDAVGLGFLLLRIPRIGMELPPVALDPANYVRQTEEEARERQELCFEALRKIEARRVGKAQLDEIGKRICTRLNVPGPWWQHLDQGTPEEIKEVARAVAEWADGDSVAAHIGYGCDYFCTEDRADGRHSIVNKANRAWLSSDYGVRFVTVAELAGML